jgi:hypothetical protein
MIALLAVLGATAAMSNEPDVRCAIALGYVKQVIEARGRRLVFSTYEGPILDIINGGWFEAGEDTFPKPQAAPAPSPALMDRLTRTNTNAVRRCSSVRHFLRSKGIPYGQRAAKAVRTEGRFKAYIQTVSLPVISGDRRRALLHRSEVRGSADAGSWFELLERQPNGQWKVVRSRPTWMS